MFNKFVDPDSAGDIGYERRPRGSKKPAENQFNPINEHNEYSKTLAASDATASIDIDHPEKPCKACVDFKDWLRTASTVNPNPRPTLEQQVSINSDCPLMRDDLGRASWSLLHTMAAYYPTRPQDDDRRSMSQFIDSFSKLFPCPECRADFQEEVSKSPPDLASRLGLSTWMCNQHNLVNKKLGKPEFDCRRVLERWRDGPADGRCD